MNRRELLKMVAAATGSVVVGGEFFLAGCKNPDAGTAGKDITDFDVAFFDEVAETIFPKTSTPGAKEAKVGQFMKVMVADCLTAEDQKAFLNGKAAINAACNKMHGHDFMKATPEQRKAVLVSLDPEVKGHQQKRREFMKEQADLEKKAQANGDTNFKKKTMSDHYFTMMKQYTILGYFTSKEGREGATNYQPVPTRYNGNVDYKKGDKVLTGLG